MGAVQILICANLLVPLFVWVLFFSFFTPPPTPSLLLSHSLLVPCLPTVPVPPIDVDVKYFKRTLLFGDSAPRADGPPPNRPQCMQISIQSSPGCFQYNTSASGPVLIPLYPQPMHCFIQSNALSAVSTWTSGHITEPPQPPHSVPPSPLNPSAKKKKCVSACVRRRRALFCFFFLSEASLR